MKAVRLLLFLILVVLVVALVVAGLALSSGVQTWAARRYLAGHPELRTSIGSVSVGLHSIRVRDLRTERNGMILTVPSLDAELPLASAALNHRVELRTLVAKGWTVDLTHAKPGTAALLPHASPDLSLLPSAHAAGGQDAPPEALFQGIFGQLRLPVDLSVDRVDAEGEALLAAPGTAPGEPIRVRVSVSGGGLAAGKEGSFPFRVNSSGGGPASPVGTLAAEGTLSAAMATPRTFNRLAVRAGAEAQGPKFPSGVRLSVDLSAAQAADGETYRAVVARDQKELVSAHAGFPAATHALGGDWKLNVSDGDVAPFALGRALPSFEAVGEGKFGLGATFSEAHVSGTIHARADRLNSALPQLAAVGALQLSAEFDLTHRGSLVRIDQLHAVLSGSKPVLTAEGLQAFAFRTDTGELEVADAAKDLLGVTLQGLPLEWAQPFLSGIALTGGPVSGAFVASARNGGLTLRSTSPLTVPGLSVSQGERPLLKGLDVSLTVSADYTPQGFQAEVSPCTLTASASSPTPGARRPLLTLEVKCGRLAGAGATLKATGRVSADLPGLIAQPVILSAINSSQAAQSRAPLTRGELACDFSAALGAAREIQAKLSITNLEADPSLTKEALPAITADLRADAAADGKLTFSAPLVFTRGDRKSDLTLAGTLQAAPGNLHIEGQLTSTRLVLEDVKVLGAPFAQPAPQEPPPGAPVKPKAALWAGISGQLTLGLKHVEFMNVQMDDVAGTLKVDPSSLSLENLRAGLGDGGDMKLNGGLQFAASNPQPYGLKADLAVNSFDPASIFKALNPDQLPTVEGKFNLAARLTGSGVDPADLAAKAGGDCQVTSKGGTFRMLSTSVSTDVQAANKVAAIGSLLGNLASSVGVGKKASDFTTAAQAVAEFAKALSPIKYDQLSVAIVRDATYNTVLKDFTLIAPEMRLAGTGQVTYQEKTPLLEQPLAMEFKLRVRGHIADAMKYAGVLESQPDELGYLACNLPLRVKGSLAKPDSSDVRNALANLALQKGGNLLDKLFGK